MEWTPHSDKQELAIASQKPLVVTGTGIQWGKTSVGAIKSKIAAHSFTGKEDNFLILAPTYKIMQQSTLPPFLAMMRGYGEYSKVDAVFKVNGGGTFYCRTATDPDSIVGITNVRFIWGDEAGLYSLYFWENIQARAAFKEAQIVLTTSPYTLNWVFKEIIRPKQKDPTARQDVELVQAASWENPYMPRGMIERARERMDRRRFNAMFGGQWERMTGLVYDCFDETSNQCEAFALPTGTRIVGGIDWGYTEPFVFKVRAVMPNGAQFGIHEFYRSGLTIMDIEQVLLRICNIYDVSAIYCGPDQPASIEHLNRAFTRSKMKAYCIAAENNVRLGIDRHYELMKTRQLKYFREANPHTLDEIESYHYPEPHDVRPDQAQKDQMPVQQNDHAMDADRYISVMTFMGMNKRTPFVPEEKKAESQYDRIERLKRPTSRHKQTEKWS